jgi:hypothetical protein
MVIQKRQCFKMKIASVMLQFHVFSFHSIHFQRLFRLMYQSRNGYSKKALC